MYDFINHPEYGKAKPLYDACMAYRLDGQDNVKFSKTAFCLCIAQKFSFDGRIPDKELSIYAENFGELLRTKQEKSDVFYPHSINDCESCRYEIDNSDLKPFCTGPGIKLGMTRTRHHEHDPYKDLGTLLGLALKYSSNSNKNQTLNSHSEAAPDCREIDIKKRIVRCHVTSSPHFGTDVMCDKGSLTNNGVWECMGRLERTESLNKVYYCDTETQFYDEDVDVVIGKICK